MNDLEYNRHVPIYTNDLYLELQKIEERGIRLRQTRMRWFAAFIGFGNRKRQNPAAAETV